MKTYQRIKKEAYSKRSSEIVIWNAFSDFTAFLEDCEEMMGLDVKIQRGSIPGIRKLLTSSNDYFYSEGIKEFQYRVESLSKYFDPPSKRK